MWPSYGGTKHLDMDPCFAKNERCFEELPGSGSWDDEAVVYKLKPIYRCQQAILEPLRETYVDSIRRWLAPYDGVSGMAALEDADFSRARAALIKFADDLLRREKESLRERDIGRFFVGMNRDFMITEEEPWLEMVKGTWFDEDDEILKSGDTQKIWDEYNRRRADVSDEWPECVPQEPQETAKPAEAGWKKHCVNLNYLCRVLPR